MNLSDYMKNNAVFLSSTSTVGYEPTREEIIDEIVHHARKVASSHWLLRGIHIKRLNYWTKQYMKPTCLEHGPSCPGIPTHIPHKDECEINVFSSRGCERGTKSCVVRHTDSVDKKNV